MTICIWTLFQCKNGIPDCPPFSTSLNMFCGKTEKLSSVIPRIHNMVKVAFCPLFHEYKSSIWPKYIWKMSTSPTVFCCYRGMWIKDTFSAFSNRPPHGHASIHRRWRFCQYNFRVTRYLNVKWHQNKQKKASKANSLAKRWHLETLNLHFGRGVENTGTWASYTFLARNGLCGLKKGRPFFYHSLLIEYNYSILTMK